jgi:5'-nucleotidase
VRFLLCNDDGVTAAGIAALKGAVEDLGEVFIVAPATEQSAKSHALTMDRPLRLRQIDDRTFSVDGTPTDCILLAVRGVPGGFAVQPDLILSGINHGANLGDDVLYSGTVAAAAEGCLMGIPAIAFSLGSWEARHLDSAARVAREIVMQVLRRELPRGTLLNVNVPDLPYAGIQGLKVTRLGRRDYLEPIAQQKDPWGRPFYWIGGDHPTWDEEEGLDFTALRAGYVSVTPLMLDLTHHAMLDRLRDWNLALSAPDARRE